MADPNLEDLAQLVGGDSPNPYTELLVAGAPAFLAKVSDSMRDVLGELGAARRQLDWLGKQHDVLKERLRKREDILETLANVHRLPAYGSEGRCAGCRRKWPCKTARILEVE